MLHFYNLIQKIFFDQVPQLLKLKFLSFYLKSKSSKLFPAISFNNLESIITKMLMYNKNEFSVIVQIKENQWNNKKNRFINQNRGFH